MAEYITVLLANGNAREKVHIEMNDLVGSDFDERFLEWLFDMAIDITRSESRPSPSPAAEVHERREVSGGRDSGGASLDRKNRLLNSALGDLDRPEKRKADGRDDGANKRRISDQYGAPSGPRAMGGEGRSLLGRISNAPRAPGGRGMPIRGAGRNGQGMNGGMGMGMGNGMMGGMGEYGERSGRSDVIDLLRRWIPTRHDAAWRCAWLWLLAHAGPKRNDGANDDDAGEYGANGRDDAKDGRGGLLHP